MTKWAEIKGYEGRYEISDSGQVRSISRLVRTMKRDGTFGLRRIKSKLLASHTWGAKYPGIVLYDEDDVGKRKMLHQLVAEAFIPNPMGYNQINHIDANSMNPEASNLEWCNTSQNVKHSYSIGNRNTGKAHHFAKLERDRFGRCLPAHKKLGGGWDIKEVGNK